MKKYLGFVSSPFGGLCCQARTVLCSLARSGHLLAGFFVWAVLALTLPASAQILPDRTNIIDNCITVICPEDDTVFICGDVYTPRNYGMTVTNRCPGVPNPQVVCTPPIGTSFPPGMHSIVCRVIRNGAVIASCDFKLTVIRDVTPPRIDCPPDITVAACPTAAGGCSAIVNYPPPAAVDNSGNVTVSCQPPSGSPFPCGTTTVTCAAFDRCQNASRCQFTVTVRPVEPPSIICPSNIVITLPCGSNCLQVAYAPPVVISGVLVGCSPPPGGCLEPGITTVTCTATNRCGDRDSCRFQIRVVQGQGEPPIIRCPSDLTVTTCSNCLPVNYPAPVVANGVLVGCRPAPGTCFPLGQTIVTCTARNGCATNECKFIVTVRPVPPPSITCPTNVVVVAPCTSNCVPVTYPAPIVVNGTLEGCDPRPGTCLPVGLHTVTCKAKNDCGDISACEFQIRVVPGQGEPPLIRCPQDIVVTTCSNCAPVVYPPPVVANGVLVGCDPRPGSCFPLGQTIVTCLASNACGRTECKFTVTVRPIPEVRIECPTQPIIVVLPCTSNCVPVTYPAPTVINGTLDGCDPRPGSCLPAGLHVITCKASDECGRQAACRFEIRVVPGPDDPPVIRCPQPITALTCSNCTVVVYPAPFVANGVLVKCDPPSGSCFPIGQTIVTCLASNRCGEAKCEFPVIVRATGELPTIRCPGDITVTTCDPCVKVNFPDPIVNNGVLIGCTPPSGFCFEVGTTLVDCIATNDCGRRKCMFNVIVRRPPPVEIRCPDDIIVTTCDNGERVDYPRPHISPTDADFVSSVVCRPPPGSFFPIGTNRVVCCVIDRCQRTNCCDFNIIVRRGGPCIKPPANMVFWLPFDEPLGPIARNLVPGAPNGLHINGPVPFLGQHVLNSLCFDGINDFVRVPNHAAIQLGFADITIDAWVLQRGDNQGRHVIVSKMGLAPGGGAPRGYELFLDNGVMHLLLSGVVARDYNSGVVVPNDNQWHFVAVTLRRGGGGEVRFYLDGALVNSQAGPVPAPLGNASALYVGAGTFPVPHAFWRGYIDELEIFCRTLTPTEIGQLFRAGRAGKCKIKCSIPWDVFYPPNQQYVTVNARIWNCSGVPMPIVWVANGPMPIPTPHGTFVLPPFTCTNVPIQLCRPTNGQPVGAIVKWTLAVYSGNQCPLVCTGSVVNPGPIICRIPGDVIPVPGTNNPVNVRIGLNGLPPGQPLRLRVIGPDMEPDLIAVSLNGLPPGEPWIRRPGALAAAGVVGEIEIPVSIRFLCADPTDLFTVLIEADVDGDGDYDTVSSFDLENPVVSPPELQIASLDRGAVRLDWNDEGKGTLEAAPTVDGPWTPVEGSRPGIVVRLNEKMRFFRVASPDLN